MKEKVLDVGERRALAQLGVSLRAGFVAVLAFYLAGALLNGRHIYEEISRRQYGAARHFWLELAAPLCKATTALRLDRVRSSIESLKEDK